MSTTATSGSLHAVVGRRVFLQRSAALCGGIPFAGTRQAPPIRRIGLAFGDDPEGGVAAFKNVLRERGYVEGRDLVIDARESGRAPNTNVAGDLARADIELLVVHSLPLALAARASNPAMPLVIVTTPGLVINGFAQSLERPGGNATGIDELPPGVTGKRLELLKAAAPAATRVALLSTTPGEEAHGVQLADATRAAAALGVVVRPYRARSRVELERTLSAIAADGMNGLLNFQGALSYINRQLIVDFAGERRIPAVYQASVFAEAGGLMTWAPNLVDQFRTAADYVDRILKGARAGDLAATYPSRYYLTLNQKAAQNLGLTFPATLLSMADRVLSSIQNFPHALMAVDRTS